MQSLMSQTVMMFTVVVLTFGSSAVVWAADFNITVPVRLSNLDSSVAKVRLTCDVVPATETTVIGFGQVDNSPDASGNFNQNVLVSFNAYSTMDPAKAARYDCWLTLVTKDGTMCSIGGSSPVKACQGTGATGAIFKAAIPKQ